jgi:hypothetical protein
VAAHEHKLPLTSTRCYACDAGAVGVRDQRPEGGMIEPACDRHRDSAIRTYHACVYCLGPRPSLTIDLDLAHKSCHLAASE